jgi:hypothetical protein
MAGDGSPTSELVEKTACVSRIQLEANAAAKPQHPNSSDHAA